MSDFSKSKLESYLLGSRPNDKKKQCCLFFKNIVKEAEDIFIKKGLPTNRNESYRYFPLIEILNQLLSSLAKKQYSPSNKEQKNTDLSESRIQSLLPYNKQRCFQLIDGFRINLINHSLAKGGLAESEPTFRYSTIMEGYRDFPLFFKNYFNRKNKFSSCPLVALNCAKWIDGLFIYIPAYTKVEKPIILSNTDRFDGSVSLYPRTFIYVGEGSSVVFCKTNSSLDKEPSFKNQVSEIVLSKNSKVEFCDVENESSPIASNCNLNHIKVYQESESFFKSNLLARSYKRGGSRYNISVDLIGEKSEANLYGVYRVYGKNNLGLHVDVNHHSSFTKSHQHYRGVVYKNSSVVFDGYVGVDSKIEKVEATQSHNGWIIEAGGKLIAKPRLSINSDDVSCHHEALITQVSQDLLFYMRSRGLSFDEAKKIILDGFLKSGLEQSSDELRAALELLATQ